MQTGTKISVGAHTAVVAWVLIGGTIFRPAPPEPAPMAVTVVSAAAFDAMLSTAPQVPGEAPAAPQIAPPAPPPDLADVARRAEEAPAPAERIAPVARPDPPEALPRADETRLAVVPLPSPDIPAPPAPPEAAAAPEAAATQIVTEAERAPTQSRRPPSRPDVPPAQAPTPEPDPAPTPPADSGMSMADALAAASDTPGPPGLSEAEVNGIAVELVAQITPCTNIRLIPFPARRMTISIELRLDPSGRPVPGSLGLESYADGDAAYAGIAFTQLSNAINDCGADGFDIPAGTHADWGYMIVAFPLPVIAESIGESY